MIDVHIHYFPLAYLDFLQQVGSTTTVARNTGGGYSGTEIAGRLAWMDLAGITMQILSATP